MSSFYEGGRLATYWLSCQHGIFIIEEVLRKPPRFTDSQCCGNCQLDSTFIHDSPRQSPFFRSSRRSDDVCHKTWFGMWHTESFVGMTLQYWTAAGCIFNGGAWPTLHESRTKLLKLFTTSWPWIWGEQWAWSGPLASWRLWQRNM